MLPFGTGENEIQEGIREELKEGFKHKRRKLEEGNINSEFNSMSIYGEEIDDGAEMKRMSLLVKADKEKDTENNKIRDEYEKEKKVKDNNNMNTEEVDMVRGSNTTLLTNPNGSELVKQQGCMISEEVNTVRGRNTTLLTNPNGSELVKQQCCMISEDIINNKEIKDNRASNITLTTSSMAGSRFQVFPQIRTAGRNEDPLGNFIPVQDTRSNMGVVTMVLDAQVKAAERVFSNIPAKYEQRRRKAEAMVSTSDPKTHINILETGQLQCYMISEEKGLTDKGLTDKGLTDKGLTD